MTVAEADAVISQAMGQSERATVRRYLRLFRWFLTAACASCLVWLCPQMLITTKFLLYMRQFALSDAAEIGVIGGADGPTAIITASRPTSFFPFDLFFQLGIPLLLLIVCIILAAKVWRLEKRLR